jgi:peptide/nickel transport system substrate-binding protein
VVFHDGTPFNATAVKLSFERTMEIGQQPAIPLDPISEINVLSEYEVEIELGSPSATFLRGIAGPFGGWIVSPTAIDEHATTEDPLATEWLTENDAGSGPYMLEDWEHGVEITLVRFEDYWEGWEGDHVTEIRLPIIPEAATQRLLLQQGEIDITGPVSGFTPEDLAAFENDPDITVTIEPGISDTGICLNTAIPPLDDVLVRKAMQYAFDQERAVADFSLAATVAVGPIPRGVWGHNDQLEPYGRDLERARDLLEEAGYPGGFELSAPKGLWYFAPFEYQGNVAQLFKENMAEIGIEVDLNGVTWPILSGAFAEPDAETRPHMGILENIPGIPDPDPLLRLQYLSGSTYNWMNWSDPRVDELAEEAATTVDQDERLAAYAEIQEIIYEETPVIWIWDFGHKYVTRSWVKGYTMNSFRYLIPDWYDLWIEDRGDTTTQTIMPLGFTLNTFIASEVQPLRSTITDL